jgi:hypothetical protein
MDRGTRLISIAVAGAVVAACFALAIEIAEFGSDDTADRRTPREPKRAEATRAKQRRSVTPRVPIAPAAVAPVPEPADETLERLVEETSPPSAWPPPRAFTERCVARGGACPAGCTELAGGRCLDPCFIHTAECSRDCLNLDGTCGFPPPDTD